MNPKLVSTDPELRRLEAIYRTFVKMNTEQQERTLNFLLSRHQQDLKTKAHGKKAKTTTTEQWQHLLGMGSV